MSTLTDIPFQFRAETFGLETQQPWGLRLARLLFNVPRTFQPLVDAYAEQDPEFMGRLEHLVAGGFVAHQPAIVLDTRSGQLAAKESRKVYRYVGTAKARRLLVDARKDLRVLGDAFPFTTPANLRGVHRMLKLLTKLDGSASHGFSVEHVCALSGLTGRTGRYWVKHLHEKGFVRRLDRKMPDVREVIPAHWRPTRAFARQLSDVIEAFENVPDSLGVELRLKRSRFLDDIHPTQLSVSGSTDYDHDVTAQQILAEMVRSPRAVKDGSFAVEPRFSLPSRWIKGSDVRAFDRFGDDVSIHQPDAILREADDAGHWLTFLEYERSQKRRDAWLHMQLFAGWMHTQAMPFERGILRFVVDSEPRERNYVELVEAFCDWLGDHPQQAPANQIRFAVSSKTRLFGTQDPLDDSHWHVIDMPTRDADERTCLLHPAANSPYDEYFGRKAQ